MKKGLLYLMMAALVGFSFAACNDKDEPDHTPEVEGEYAGTLTISLASFQDSAWSAWNPIATLPDTVIITRQAKHVVSLKLEDFQIALSDTTNPVQIGTIEIKNIQVSQTGSRFTLLGGDEIDLTEKHLGAGLAVVGGFVTLEQECKLDIEIILKIKNESGTVVSQMGIQVGFITDNYPAE
ncbi:MAG: hypothetical protein LBR65_01610 [Culturomica sp.]|jgi:hypothetical protein|nr:hypothetical protein [Culturomica sp.]